MCADDRDVDLVLYPSDIHDDVNAVIVRHSFVCRRVDVLLQQALETQLCGRVMVQESDHRVVPPQRCTSQEAAAGVRSMVVQVRPTCSGASHSQVSARGAVRTSACRARPRDP